MTTTHKDTDLREALRRRYASTPQLPDDFADRLMQHTGKPKRRHPWWLYAAIGAAASVAILLIKAPEAHKTHEAHKAPPSAPEGATIDFPRLTAHKTIDHPRPTARKTIVAPSGAEGGAFTSGAEGGALGTLEAFRQEATAIRERGEQLMQHVAMLSELPAERMEYVEFKKPISK